MRRLLAPLSLFLLGGLSVAGGLSAPAVDAAGTDVGTQVARIVSGIVSYARWPAGSEQRRFCSVGEPLHLGEVRSSLGQREDSPFSFRGVASDESAWSGQCDVLYLGAMPAAVRKKLLAKVVGQPILSITEDDSVCADTSMFCLAIQGNNVGLLANLDAISRSSIRINPKVLQLLQRRQGQP